jgi:hypothetical protein
MNYKVLDWHSANELKNKMNAVFVEQFDFNFSKKYILSDKSYLIMPLNPFGNSILTKRKDLLDKWINNHHFPSNDKVNKFYFDNQKKIDNIIANKDALKRDLCNYIFKKENIIPDTLTAREIDSIYDLLNKRETYQKYMLNFMVLVGDFVLSQYKNKSYHWGLLKIKQYLNPICHLIIVIDEKKQLFFDIEDKINGKWGYVGVQYILGNISDDLFSRVDEFSNFETIN